MNETIDSAQFVKSRHSKWIFFSNASSQLASTLIGAVQGFLLFFYQVVIGLNIWYIVLAMTIFTIYNGINDPVIGYLVDRNFKFTRKWGRRFPWIVIGIIPWSLSVYLLFTVPNIDAAVNPWSVFWWLLFTLFLLDTFGTLVSVNQNALRPDLFRTEGERRRFAKYYTPIDILAIIIGMLLPAVFIDFFPGDARASYSLMGVVIATISLIFFIVSLPGNREDKVVIDRYFSSDYKRMNFFKALWKALKSRSFIVFFVFSTCYGIQIAVVVVNMLYLTTFVLQIGADMYIVILAIYLFGTLISYPLWLRYLRKINNNKKAFVIAGLTQCAALIPLTFFVGLEDLFIWSLVLGLASGGLNAFTSTILFPSVVDDFVVRIGKNQKGVLIGIAALLGRLVATIDETIIAWVHNITGFIEGNETYAEMLVDVTAAGGDINLVLLGIRLLMGIIPAVVLLLGILVFWKWFPLTQDVVVNNKIKLEELGF